MAVKLNQHDLEFILKQIKIAEAHAAGTPLDQLIVQPHLPYGLRTVDGTYNNILDGRETWGANGQLMPRMLDASYRSGSDPTLEVDINGPAPGGIVDNHDYTEFGSETPGVNGGHSGNVVDADPRLISNLIADQTLNNPAAIIAALQHAEFDGNLTTAVTEVRALYATYLAATSAAGGNEGVIAAAKATLDTALLTSYGIEMDGNSISLPNVAPDEGLSAPFNGWMTFFGQFFDHGLDLIHKGGNGTIFIPLAADDPLRTHGPDGIAGSGDEVEPHLAFMALTRLTPAAGPGADGVVGTADDTAEATNKTTPFVDQNQTYTSHASHQVFLREYVMVMNETLGHEVPLATGNLLDGVTGGLPTWADVKLQAAEKLGIDLSDLDVFGVPLLRTDAYGEFIRGADGFPQVVINIGPDLIPNTDDDVTVSGAPDAGIDLAELNNGLGPVRTASAFLDDIAHTAVPIFDPNVPAGTPAILLPDPNSGTDDIGNPIPPDPDTGALPFYDDELLDRHFITGDGRGNENIGLTAVHHVFHSEHNRQVESNKAFILEIAASGTPEDIAFLNEWLLLDVAALPADLSTLAWDGERLFQTARFATEMQYQHLVFEEFGRKVQPLIDLFVFNTTTDVNPAIFAEFAHTVYRFGHSMLTDHVKLLPLNGDGEPVDASGNVISAVDWGVDVGLIDAFLNPVLYDQNHSISPEQAAGAIIRGMTYVQGNAIDEFVVEALRNNLLGLPLDLPAINLARGRDAGVPSLNEARAQLYEASNSTYLKPYESWVDFGANLKTPASVINFIAAYGTHDSITSETTLAGKRAAATAIVLGVSEEVVDAVAPPTGVAWAGIGSALGTIDENPLVDDEWYNATYLDVATAGIDPDTHYAAFGWSEGRNPNEFFSSQYYFDNNPDVVGNPLDHYATTGWTEGRNPSANFDGQRYLEENSDVATAGMDPLQHYLVFGRHEGRLYYPVPESGARTITPPADRLDFLNSTGGWTAQNSGLNDIDLWIGGLAEKIMPFGGMLGPTFNAVFELQMENLQEGDRFYYLSRTQGLNLLNELENNAFSKLIMANTDLARPGLDGILGTEDDEIDFHIGVDSFAKHDLVLEVDLSKQIVPDVAGEDPILEALLAKVQRDNPATEGVLDTNYLRFTGGEHAVIGGTELADTIIGGDGDDAIWGGGGNDRIEGGHGVDLIIGGDGDDIITDMGDTGDFIKGEGGDDVIANSNGLDVLMGGDGQDVFLLGVDATEVFGGEGNDFMLGGADHDFMLGNEGDDWMEGGDGFDVLNGDNSELFFNSTILGHDVMFAGSNENDFDAESGDDIMVQGESVMRNEGMLGFDWAIHKGSAVAADSDMRIPIFTTVFDDILRDRFDQTEGLSGWVHNDVLRGDDRGSTEEIEVELDMTGHELSQAGVNRINGIRDLLGISAAPAPTDPGIDLESVVAWTGGNILLGGDGNDTIEGRGGDDFIHGDAWLNVRISIRDLVDPLDPANEILTVDSLSQTITFDGETKALSEFLLSGQIKPRQLQIVREIKYDENTNNDTDTAIFAGNRDWYEITHVGDRTYVTRREHEDIDPQVDEGSDTLIGIERIQFADGIYTIRETGNYDPTGRLTISPLPAREGVEMSVSATNIRDLNNPDGMVDPNAITFRWQIERNDGTGDYINIPGSSGNSFTPSDEHDGLRIRVLGTYVDAAGVTEIVSSHPTDVVIGANDEPTGPLLISDMSPTEGQAITATVAFTDPDGMTDAFEELLLTYQWQYEVAGFWTDVPAAQGGNERVFVPGPAQVGYPMRMKVDYFDDLLNEHTVYSEVTEIVGNYIISNEPVVDAATGDAEGGTSIGDDWVEGGDANNTISGGAGNDVINGGGGTDTLNGGEGDDTLTGNGSSDTVNGGEGNDTIVLGIDDGNDLIDGGAGSDRVRVRQSGDVNNDNVTVVMAAGIISQIGGATITSVESVELETGGGVDTLTYTTADNLSVNLLTGAATGFAFTRGLENVNGGSGNDTLLGNSLDNSFEGRGGNDILRGGFGNDRLIGGDDNDQLWGEVGDDVLEGGDGNDRIDGGLGNDTASFASASLGVTISMAGTTSFEAQNTFGAGIDEIINIENLTGSAHADNLTGSSGDNIIDGGAGADTMTGGAGDDTYVVSDAGDAVIEALDGGADEVRSALADYTLADNVENLVLTGAGNSNGTGNGLNNKLTGNAGTNTLNGAIGIDTIVLAGAIADHAFALSGGNVTVTSADGGTDTLIDIEQVEIGGQSYAIVAGTNVPNVPLSGTAANEILLGFNGADTLEAGGGNDILIGGNAADIMRGGLGDDTYVVNNDADTVDELGGDGDDTIISSISRNLNNAQVTGDVENLTLVGTGDINGTGNGLANTLIGNSGNNTLGGLGGADILIGNAGDDTLNGGGANDMLTGGEGNDALNGQGGTADVAVFSGPAGNYSFGVTTGALATVTDMVGTDGVDTLANIERIQFGDGEILDVVTEAGVATGPSLIFGTDAGETIVGSSGDDVIIGGAGDDTLHGHNIGDGDDDTAALVPDDDIFIWDAADGGDGLDTINGGGEDLNGDTFQIIGNEEAEIYRIYTYAEAVARIGYAGSDEVEIVVTREVGGVGEAGATAIAELTEIEEIVINGAGISGTGGTALGDTVEMYGTFDVTTSLRPDTITIIGSSGDDTVNISSLLSAHRIVFKTKGGNDTIIGTVRPQDVIELEGGQTIDDYVLTQNQDGSTTITSDTHSVTFYSTGQTPQFGGGDDEDIDDVTPSPADDDGHVGGNDDNNNDGDDDNDNDDEEDDDEEDDADDHDDDGDEGVVPSVPGIGTPSADVLIGTDLSDHLIGFAGDDVLIGKGGNDVLVAGAGHDFLAGWAGDDMIFGDAGDDTILGGDGNDMISGGEGADRIMADAGNDLVDAGAGNDSVIGGAGNDDFTASAGDGNDVYFGDELNGGSGIDMLDMRTVSSDTTVDLGSGLQGLGSAISGQSGHDTLWGIENVATGSGADTIIASDAVNVIDGGTGNDTFRFKSIAAADGDTIIGFESGDKIDLSMIDADGGANFGNQAFTTIMNGPATALAQLVITHENVDGDAYTVIRGHVTDTDEADFTINIQGTHTLNAGHFYL